MAQIGYGYGSEFQLLRFLGHHRNDLDKMIKEQAGIDKNIPIEWFDFNYGDRDKKIVADNELQGFSFLTDDDTNKVVNLPIFTKTWQHWDAVFKAGNTYYIIEAKAYANELKSTDNGHGGKSRDEILTLMQKTLEKINVVPDEKWFGNYYQFANRLTTTMFLNKHGIKTKLICLFFIDGYPAKRDITQEDFQNAIKKELEELGLTNVDLSKYVVNVFIDANKRNDK